MKRYGSILALAVAAFLTASAGARAADIVIGVPNWSSATVTSHVLGRIIEERFDLDVEIRPATNEEIFAGMDKGEIHIHPEVWLPNYKALHDEYVLRRKTVEMSPHGVPASQGTCVTRDTYEKHGIHSISDLTDPEKVDIFDTDGDGRGEMWIGAPEWGSTRVEQVRAHDYGYDKTMQLLKAEETVALAAVDASIATGKPMVFYCYEPHHVFELHDIVFLDEPPHDPRKWSILDGNNENWREASSAGVAWPPSFFHIFYAQALEESHPELAAFLSSVTLDVDTVSQMTYALVVEHRDPDAFADDWVAGHEARVSNWLQTSR